MFNPKPTVQWFLEPFPLPAGFGPDARAQQRHYARLLALSAECIRDPLPLDPKYHFATYVKTEEERCG